jgi:phosphatidate phosphatase APP1
MPELYKYILDLNGSTTPFFYLSASPYNLYPFLHDFRTKFYPPGQLILRDASWQSVEGLFTSLTLGAGDYKVDRMDKIHKWLPECHMICIGDSTQQDPEAYGQCFPTLVGVICLTL